MSKRLYYAIDYRRMHTGIHGLLIYEDRKSAEKSMVTIQKLLQEVDRLDRESKTTEKDRDDMNIYYQRVIQHIFDNTDIVIDEIDYRNIVWDVKYGNNVKEYKHKLNDRVVRIINTTVDLYV